MSVSLAEAAEREWGKPDIVIVPEERWQKALKRYQELKQVLEELPPEEIIETRPEVLDRPFGPCR